MPFEEEKGAIAGTVATDDDKEMRSAGSLWAHGFDSLYLNPLLQQRKDRDEQ